jgi:regulation of enolase protein 1 (concanavalin A-like superfamily)
MGRRGAAPRYTICEDEPIVDRDDFEGDSLDEDRWTVVEPDPENLSVEDGQLNIQTVPGRDFFAGDGTLPNVVVQDLPDGAWTATTSMDWTPTQNFQNAGLVVWTDEDNYVKAGMVHSGGRGFELIKEVGGSPSFAGTVNVGGDFPSEFQLRYVYDDGTLEAQFSADGDSWTSIGTTDLDGLDSPSVGVYATNSTSSAATEPPMASFNWFSLEDVCPEPGDPGDPAEVSAALDPDEPDGEAGWYVSPVTVTLTADAGADVEYRLGGDEWLEYDGPVTVDEDGEHTVEYRASNESGTSDVGSVAFSLDQAPPETSATLEGDEDGDGYVGPVTVTLSAEDATSGVAATHYRMAGDDDHVEYDEPFVVMGEGEQTVEFRSVDVAGNVEEWQQVTFDVAPLECPEPDERETVVVGGADSGVANRDVGNGCTINDLIIDREEWPNHGAFVRHVREVTDQLVDDGVITAREGRDINRAAAQSGAGRPGGGGSV